MLNSWATFQDPDGTLVPIEFDKLPFVPKRAFYITGIPKGAERGRHAHYQTQQILTCIQGEVLVKLHDGKSLQSVTLNKNEWVFIDKMIWDSQVFLTGRDVLMSLCSTNYDKADYIEDFDAFLKITGNTQ